MSPIEPETWLQHVDDLGEVGRVGAVTCEEDQKLFRALLIMALAPGERASIDAVELILRRLKTKPIPGAVMLVQMDALANAANNPDRKTTVALHDRISSSIKNVLSSLP